MDPDLDHLDDLLARGAFQSAFDQLEALVRRHPEDPEVRARHADVRLQQGDLEGAAEDYRWAVDRLPTEPELRFALAVVEELLGREQEAARHLARAADLDPVGHPLPEAMDPHAFEALLTEAIDALPEPIRQHLQGLVVEVEPLADPEEFRERAEPYDPLLLGYFYGVPLLERTSDYQPGLETDRVWIYQRAHELCFRTLEQVTLEARRTLYHELAHFLGFEEEEMERLGVE